RLPAWPGQQQVRHDGQQAQRRLSRSHDVRRLRLPAAVPGGGRSINDDRAPAPRFTPDPSGPASATEQGATPMNLFVLKTWLQARFTKDERGANLVEYLLLVSLIAMAVMAAVIFMGSQLNSGFDNAGSKVSATP